MSCYCYNCMKSIKENTGVCPHCGQAPFGVNPVHQLKQGTILQGRYLIGKTLGQGGFGITYIGLDTKLEQPVAIKEYYPNGISHRNNEATDVVTVTSSENIYRHGKDRFLLEARNLAKFKSEPGIVGVQDYFEENNTAYIVMDYIEGVTLKEWVETKGPFSANACFKMMKPIVDVLERVHSQKIIHRDISPDNIMKTPEGELILLDFGAAREVSGDKSISVMLKPGYAPYEQYCGNGNQGPWTDVYALCATMYFCMTGVKPDESPDRMENDTLKRPSELSVKISGAEESALLHGMAVREKERFRSISELKSALFDDDKTVHCKSRTIYTKGELGGQTQLDIEGQTCSGSRANKTVENLGNGNRRGNDHHKKVAWQNYLIGVLVLVVVVLIIQQINNKPTPSDPPIVSVEPTLDPTPTILPTVSPAPTMVTDPTPTPVPAPTPMLEVIDYGRNNRLAAGNNHTAFLHADSTVSAVGSNQDGQCDVSNWSDVVAVAAGNRHTVGLHADGTVVATGHNGYDQCNVSGWTEITAVAAGGNHTVGLRSDGTVVAVGWTNYGQCNVSDWSEISSVAAGIGHTVGLRSNGTVVAVGDNRYGQCDISRWTDIIAISAGNYHTVGLRADGSVVAAGDNRYDRCDVSDWMDIVAISAGERHTVGLRTDGTVIATGDNQYRQCDVSLWTDIVAIAAGWYHTAGIRNDGTTVAVGYNEYGQCNISSQVNIVSTSAAPQTLTLSAYEGDLTGYSQILFKEASASSSFTENGYTYYPKYAVDQDVERPWVEGVKGDGIGEYLLLSFDRLESINLLSIHPGFTSAYEKNNRPKNIEFTFSDGSSVKYELEDLNTDLYIQFNKPVTTRFIKITIQSVYAGKVPDTCISEVSAFTSVR